MKNIINAPVVIFAYNRISALKNMIDSLKRNSESKFTDIYFFIDGPKNELDSIKVNKVIEFVKCLDGFKKIQIQTSKINKGLSKSIINGLSFIFRKYDFAIILEDDLILSSNFLSYMNNSLSFYEGCDKIISISGYSNKVDLYDEYSYDSYFSTRNSSWGWATWKKQWIKIDWNLNDWKKVKSNSKSFNKYCGSDCFKMLDDWKKGFNQSWAIRFVYSQFVQQKLSLSPVKSKIINNGFNSEGTHCVGDNRFKSDFDLTNNKEFYFPEKILLDKKINRQAMRYHSLLYRIKSKIKNFKIGK
mgnify:CR=1 FL=1